MQFAKTEAAERVKTLRLPDRVALASGRALLGSRPVRTAALVYAVVLHLLVFVILWRSSHLHQARAKEKALNFGPACGFFCRFLNLEFPPFFYPHLRIL